MVGSHRIGGPLRSISALTLCALSAGCGFLDAPGDPITLAHRAGAASWPENSRTAVHGSLAAGVDGLAVDVFLTSDRVPVLVELPWLPEDTCETIDGNPITSRIYLLEHTLAELDQGWQCGGTADPMFPKAEVVADTLMTLDELIDAVAEQPAVAVQLDLKYHPGISHDPEVFAAEILERWWAAELTNPLVLSGSSEDQSVAVQDRAASRDRAVETWLTWPSARLDGTGEGPRLGQELSASAGFSDMVTAADRAQATGLNLSWRLMDRRLVEDATDMGFGVAVGRVNDARVLSQMNRWPVDVVLSDHVGGPQ